jgi:hypothetical protein
MWVFGIPLDIFSLVTFYQLGVPGPCHRSRTNSGGSSILEEMKHRSIWIWTLVDAYIQETGVCVYTVQHLPYSCFGGFGRVDRTAASRNCCTVWCDGMKPRRSCGKHGVGSTHHNSPHVLSNGTTMSRLLCPTYSGRCLNVTAHA